MAVCPVGPSTRVVRAVFEVHAAHSGPADRGRRGCGHCAPRSRLSWPSIGRSGRNRHVRGSRDSATMCSRDPRLVPRAHVRGSRRVGGAARRARGHRKIRDEGWASEHAGVTTDGVATVPVSSRSTSTISSRRSRLGHLLRPWFGTAKVGPRAVRAPPAPEAIGAFADLGLPRVPRSEAPRHPDDRAPAPHACSARWRSRLPHVAQAWAGLRCCEPASTGSSRARRGPGCSRPLAFAGQDLDETTTATWHILPKRVGAAVEEAAAASCVRLVMCATPRSSLRG